MNWIFPIQLKGFGKILSSDNMTETLIGTAITNEKGIAIITYTAQGAGDIKIIAECEDAVSSSIIIHDNL